MAVDWLTVAASGATGAVAGGVVSWVAAPHVAWRQERGQTRADARRKIGELVAPVLTEMRQYQDHARSDLSRGGEENEKFHFSDMTLCSQLLSASGALPWWRRALVKRRLVQLFGSDTVDLCAVHGDFGNAPPEALRIVLNRQINAMKNPGRFKLPDRGEYDKALRAGPDSKEVGEVINSLQRLATAR